MNVRRRVRGSGRELWSADAATFDVPGAQCVVAGDVATLLDRIGECVRALPSFGRTRTPSVRGARGCDPVRHDLALMAEIDRLLDLQSRCCA
jgi:hypothetical protein